MPVIKVWCLPDLPENEYGRLHKAIVGAVCAVKELDLKTEDDMTVLFPADKMKYGLGTVIVVEVTGLTDKPERTLAVRQRLALNIGLIVSEIFPDAKIESFVYPDDKVRDAFWCSNELKLKGSENGKS